MAGKQAALSLNIGTNDAAAERKIKALSALARSESAKATQAMAKEISATNRVALTEERLHTQVTKTLTEEARARKANAQAAKAEADAQAALNRVLNQRPKAGFAQNFQRSVYSSRFSLPGTGGNIMPLVGNAVRGGAGGFAGVAAMGLAGLASEGVARAIRNSGELEAALNRLQGRTGATDAQLTKLRETARGLGADLTLPGVNSNDAALAIERLASKGLSLQDSMDGAKGALQLATVAHLEFAEAADITADALNAFGLEGSKATQVADAFAAATVKSGTPVRELYDALRQVGPVARQTGLTLNETLTILSQFGRSGLRGSDAGTSLKTFLLALTAPTKDAKKELEKLGVAIYNTAGQVRPYRSIVQDLGAALGKMSEAQRNAAMRTIFGTDAIRAAGIVVRDGTDGFDDMAKAVGKVGEAQRQTEAQTRGLKGAVEGFNSTLDSILEKKATDSGLVKLLTEIINLGTQGISTLDNLLTYAMKLGDDSLFGKIIGNMKSMREGMAAADAERNNPQAFKLANMASDLKQARGLLANGDQRGGAGLMSAPLPASPLWERYGVQFNAFNQNQSIKDLILKIEAEQRAMVADAAEVARLKGRSGRESQAPARGASRGKNPPSTTDTDKARREAERRESQRLNAIARSAETGARRSEDAYRVLLDDYDGRSTVTLQGKALAPNPEGEVKRLALVKAIENLRVQETEAAKRRLEAEKKSDPAGAEQRYSDALTEISDTYEKRRKAIKDKDSGQLKKIEEDKADADLTRMQENLDMLQAGLKKEIESLSKAIDPAERESLFRDALDSASVIRGQKVAIADARLRRAKRSGGPLEGALADYSASESQAGREYDELTTGDLIEAQTKGAKTQEEKLAEAWKLWAKKLEMAQKAQEEQKRLEDDLLDYRREVGAVTTAEYLANLDEQIAATEQYSAEWIALSRKRHQVEQEEAKKSEDSYAKLMDKLKEYIEAKARTEKATQKYFDRTKLQLADSIGREVGDSIEHFHSFETFAKGWGDRITRIFSDIASEIISDWARVQLIGGARAGVPGMNGASLLGLGAKGSGEAGGSGVGGGAAAMSGLTTLGIAVGANTILDRVFGKRNPFRKILPHFATGGTTAASPFIAGEGGLSELFASNGGGFTALPGPALYAPSTGGRILSHRQVAQVADKLNRSGGGGSVIHAPLYVEHVHQNSDLEALQASHTRTLVNQLHMN